MSDELKLINELITVIEIKEKTINTLKEVLDMMEYYDGGEKYDCN